MESFSTEAAVLKCVLSNFCLEIRKSFRTTSQKFVLENYVLAYHTADKDHAEILLTVFPSFLRVFCALSKSKSKR